MPFLELARASYSYPGSASLALDGLSLSIGEGEYVAIVGANGSGKSSLLRLLNGLRLPDSGEVRLDGSPTSRPEGRAAARSSVGLVFQSPADQIVSSSVVEDVAFGPENLGLPRAEIEARVAAALAAVGLAGERDRASHFLSAGQQQRLAIAGVLAIGPRCIAFDEATAMLDPEARLAVLALMDGLVESGVAVLHVTHDLSEAARASRILVLEAGALVFDGTPDTLLSAGARSIGAVLALGLPDCAAIAIGLGLEPRIGESAASLAGRIAASRDRGVVSPHLTGPKASELAGTTRAASAPGAAPAFVLEKASHSYLRGTANETESLRGLDLSVPEGSSFALVGRTGSGKSTALQLLDGLVAAGSGEVRALGVDLGGPRVDLRALRMRAPLAIQRPEAALFERYAGDDVAFGPRNLGLAGKALVGRVRDSMEETGLAYAEFRDRLTRSLSGGEKRRLALAGVLAMGGDALLLDEPTCALDPGAKRSIRELLLGRARRGATVLIATHSMEEAAGADAIAVFDRGRVVASGDPATIFYDLYDPSWGIGRPFACEVAIELESLGLALGRRPLAIGDLVAALGGRP